jgi:peptidoglycan/xylan/chitin deacetylase (PgdA/CDA1 family)
MNRRDFFNESVWLATGAVMAARVGPGLSAQTRSTPVRGPGRYGDSLIVERKAFKWPGGKTLAIWIIPNVEVWDFQSGSGAAISPQAGNVSPDVINYAWREYGMRVGLWRIADALDSLGMRATVALNSGVCQAFPQAIEQMKKRGWEFMGHGITNSKTLANLSLDEERQTIREVLRTIEQATGEKPRGWLGPGLTETVNTPDVLAEEGVQYVGDWNNDDQPYPMKVKKGKLFSVPYCMDLNDMNLLNRHAYTGEQYLQALTDQFETLYAESERTAKVMGIPLHPFLAGQPLYTRYLQQALAKMKTRERVWFTTGSEIVKAYEQVHS